MKKLSLEKSNRESLIQGLHQADPLFTTKDKVLPYFLQSLFYLLRRRNARAVN
jgi:hypothetical protein